MNFKTGLNYLQFSNLTLNMLSISINSSLLILSYILLNISV